MSLRTSRLTPAEWLLGIASAAMLVDLFAFSWFGYEPRFRALATMLGQSSSANGWNTFTVLGPLTVVVCVAGIAIPLLTAARRSPAVPVVITTLLLPVSFIQAVLVAIRVLLASPSVHLAQAGGANVIETRPGAYAGLALSVLTFAGVYLTLRRDGVAPEDAPAVSETVRVGQPRRESPA